LCLRARPRTRSSTRARRWCRVVCSGDVSMHILAIILRAKRAHCYCWRRGTIISSHMSIFIQNTTTDAWSYITSTLPPCPSRCPRRVATGALMSAAVSYNGRVIVHPCTCARAKDAPTTNISQRPNSTRLNSTQLNSTHLVPSLDNTIHQPPEI
jgi:hypothetical protein